MKALVSIILAVIGIFLICFGINSLSSEVPIWLDGIDINAAYTFSIINIIVGAILCLVAIIMFATRHKMKTDNVFKHKF